VNISFSFQTTMGDFKLDVTATTAAPITGIFGPSGCGKSSLLHLIAGLRRADSGFLEVDGETLYNSQQRIMVPPHRRRVAVVFQESRLFPHMSVAENLRYGLKGLRPAQQRFSYDEIVRWLDLGELLKKSTPQLSGGESQRIALARALLSSPRILLLDEPMASLDRGHTRRILPLLRQIQEQTSIPMLHVSHDLGELLQLTEHLLVLRQGQVVGHDSFLELLIRPDVLNLIHDLGLLNVIKMEVIATDGSMGITRLRPLDDPTSQQLWSGPPADSREIRLFAGIRPEDIALVRHPVEGSSIQNQIWGKVSKVITAGHRVLVVVETSVRLLAEITPQAALNMNLQPGQDIYCLFKAHALRYL